MKREINPQESNRAEAFSMWMSSPMPMVTFLRPVGSKRPEVERVKTLDVSRLVKVSRRTGMKFTMLMCWCIGKAASSVEEFFLLPQDGRLFRYDRLAINIVVQNVKGGISLCD